MNSAQTDSQTDIERNSISAIHCVHLAGIIILRLPAP